MRSVTRLAIFALAATACTDQPSPLTAPVAAPDRSIAYVTLSNAQPAQGSVILVTVNTGAGAGADGLGSFTARLLLGPGLEFVEESAVACGAHAIRVSGDTVTVAGASATGFVDGQLFAVKARVVDPRLLPAITLTFTEANTVHFGNQFAALKVERGVFVAPRQVK